VVLFMIWRLVQQLDAEARATLLGTAAVIWMFRAMPGAGAGSSWWMIDQLKFDQQFLAQLSLIASALTLAALFAFRRFMAERSIYYIVGFLTIAGAILMLPQLGMVYGVHEWTAARTGGVVDARFIAMIDTALESPLGTKYLNKWFTVTREVKDPATGAIKVPADFSQLGELFIVVTLIALVLPLATIWIVRLARMRSA